jgi:hypothetical protein
VGEVGKTGNTPGGGLPLLDLDSSVEEERMARRRGLRAASHENLILAGAESRSSLCISSGKVRMRRRENAGMIALLTTACLPSAVTFPRVGFAWYRHCGHK